MNSTEPMVQDFAIIQRLVEASKDGLLVLVIGERGSGKVELSRLAIRQLGLNLQVVDMSLLDEMDLHGMLNQTRGILDRIPDNMGLIIDSLDQVSTMMVQSVAIALNRYLCVQGRKRVAFATVTPHGLERLRSLPVFPGMLAHLFSSNVVTVKVWWERYTPDANELESLQDKIAALSVYHHMSQEDVRDHVKSATGKTPTNPENACHLLDVADLRRVIQHMTDHSPKEVPSGWFRKSAPR